MLIIGAGPFGVSMATYAAYLDIDHITVGKPMDFWKSNMPRGMFLRSACDWHLDPLNTHTITAYLHTRRLTPRDVEPLSRETYLDYAQWFQEQKRIEPVPVLVDSLDFGGDAHRPFQATLENGDVVVARRVVLAIGFRYFKDLPASLTDRLPPGSFSHTCDLVEFERLKGKRCLIIGGRQSAYEWAALLQEAGGAAIHLSHRHETPQFRESDWSWANQAVAGIIDNPGWYRSLSPDEQQGVNQRLWAEGRLKLEPWLWPRINRGHVKRWPKSELATCDTRADGDYEVNLDNGESLRVDHIILATGYKVDMARVPFLAKGNVLSKLRVNEGYPVLDESLQSNIPGLFITSLPASRDFGPFFGFTVSVNASAKIIGAALTEPGS